MSEPLQTATLKKLNLDTAEWEEFGSFTRSVRVVTEYGVLEVGVDAYGVKVRLPDGILLIEPNAANTIYILQKRWDE